MKQNIYDITRRALRRAALAAALALAALPAAAGPIYDFKVDELCYNINKDGQSVTVTYEQFESYSYSASAYPNASGKLTIPASVTYGGKSYAVTAIGDYAFANCKGFIGTLTIPNTVTTIGSSAFKNCSGLTGTLTIPNSITTIHDNAFSNCSGFTGTLTIPNSVTTIGSAAFINCSGLTGTLTIPNSVTTIHDNAFRNCSGFTGTLTIPNSVTTIGVMAFRHCLGLSGRLTVPKSVKSIGIYAFGECEGITDISLLNDYIELEGWTFDDTGWYINQPDGMLYLGQVLYRYKGDVIPGSTIEIKDGTKSIASHALYECSNFTGSLHIPNSVIIIGDRSFYGCSGLSGSLYIPNSVKTIGEHAFSGCSGLSGSLSLSNSVETIGAGAFANCGFTGSLKIPNSIETIEYGTFENCGFTGSLSIPNSVKTIESGAFSNCKGFTGSLMIPNSVKRIGDEAFSYCHGFTGSITLSNAITEIGDHAFFRCDGFTGSLTIPNTVKGIGYGAFQECSGLSGALNIPNTLTYISESTFFECSGLSSLDIPETLTNIGDRAFAYCRGLKSIKNRIAHPANVTLGYDVFEGIDKDACTLYVGKWCREEYAKAAQWRDFRNIVETEVRGDVDGNGIVEIDDVNLVANVVLRKANADDWPAADVDGNRIVDIDDLNGVVNVILKKPQSSVTTTTYTVNGVSFEMVNVEGGTFTMGATAEQGDDYSDDELPTHQVTLSRFAIGDTEVTQALWMAVMGSNPSYFNEYGNLNYGSDHGDTNYGTNNSRPVEFVSWDDCQEFITKLNALTGKAFRLPTEAEWEYAARGGIKSNGYKYSGSNTIDDVAHYHGNSNTTPGTWGYGTSTTGKFSQWNELDISDMSGNVEEWCHDRYSSTYYSNSPSTNPTGPTSGSYRVCRGGSWNDRATGCRVSRRNFYPPASRANNIGLRLAL